MDTPLSNVVALWPLSPLVIEMSVNEAELSRGGVTAGARNLNLGRAVSLFLD